MASLTKTDVVRVPNQSNSRENSPIEKLNPSISKISKTKQNDFDYREDLNPQENYNHNNINNEYINEINTNKFGFNYDDYFNKYDQKVLINKHTEETKPKNVKKSSVLQMINDLTHLDKIGIENSLPNVEFKIGNSSIFMHSLLLLVRSDWFRRSWRKYNIQADPSKQSDEYDIRNNQNFHFKLKLDSEIPNLPNGKFIYRLILLKRKDQTKLINAFKQFKTLLYKGNCDIDQENSKYLVGLANIFQIEMFEPLLGNYFRKSISLNDMDAFVECIELAHVYQLKELKDELIKIVNKNSIRIINSKSWSYLADNYPELVLEIFRKNNN